MENKNPVPRTTSVSNPYSSKKETTSLPLDLPKTPRDLFLSHLPSSVTQLDKETQSEKPVRGFPSNESNNADNDVPWAQRLLGSQVPMFAEIRTVSEYQNLQPIQGQCYRLTGKLVHKTVHSPTCISLVLEDPLQSPSQRSRKRRVSFPLSTGTKSITCRTPGTVDSTPKYLGGKAPASVIRRKSSLLRKTPPLQTTPAPPPSPIDMLIDALKARVWVVVRHIPLNDIAVGDLVMVLGSTQIVDRNMENAFTKDEDAELLRIRSAVGTDMKLYQQALMARRAFLSQSESAPLNA